MTATRIAVLAAVTAVLVQCAPPPAPAPAPPQTTTAPPERTSPPEKTTATAPKPPPSPRPEPARIQPVTAADLGTTWRPGCPLAPEDLRSVDLDYRGFDGQTHRGRLVVNQELTSQFIDAFARLYELRYPIERMQTPDHYPDAEDELSMRDNNTSAFNCRDIPGTGNWSLHAYGRAVDINPLLNPYIDGQGDLQPATAGPYLDRGRTDPGVLHDGDAAVRVFADAGWTWGGDWRSPKDYQHFEMS